MEEGSPQLTASRKLKLLCLLLLDCNQSCSLKILFGQVEVSVGLAHATYSLSEWQAVKLTFFTPWQIHDFACEIIFGNFNCYIFKLF